MASDQHPLRLTRQPTNVHEVRGVTEVIVMADPNTWRQPSISLSDTAVREDGDAWQPLPVFVPKAASPVRILAGPDLMPLSKARTRLADIFARIAPGPRRTKARDLLFDLLINGRVEPCRALSDLQSDAIAIRHRGNESPSDAAVLE